MLSTRFENRADRYLEPIMFKDFGLTRRIEDIAANIETIELQQGRLFEVRR